MTDIVKKIITNVLTALYQPFGFSLLLAVLAMFLYLYAMEHGWKEVLSRWWKAFQTDTVFRRMFLLVFYTALILFRTLLNRNLWANPLSNVMGGWGLHTDKGDLTTEAVENLLLFLPFTILLLRALPEKLMNQNRGLKQMAWISLKVTFLCSGSIEFLQLFLRLGTFQLSDLFYNTMGGCLGGLLYWAGCRFLGGQHHR